jgi:3-hydroxybutyryl-CoA dehydratase
MKARRPPDDPSMEEHMTSFTGATIHDIPVGLTATGTRTVGESDVYLFAGITGDFDPNHVDEEYCRTTPLGHRVAHGALIVGYMSMASTRVLDGFEAPVVSLGYDRVRHTKPVYIGDTITVHYRIATVDVERRRLTAEVRVTNQRGELVTIATHIQQLL